MQRTLVRFATVAGAVIALAVPVPQPAGASTPVEDQLFLAALKPDPAGRTLAFRAWPEAEFTQPSWAFGDGTTAQGYRPQHTFPAGTGTFTVTLTVTFTGSGATRTVSKVVQPAGQPPQLQLTTPSSGTTFAAGDAVHASAAAPDAAEIRWATSTHRCAPGCHFEYPDHVIGASYDVSYPAFSPRSGISNPVSVEVFATAASGLSSSARFSLNARLRSLRLGGDLPSGINLDGVPIASDSSGQPQDSFSAHVGSTVTIEASATALAGAAPFQSWNDGSTARTRQLVMPDQTVDLRTDYLTPIEARYNSDAGLRSLLGPQTQPEGQGGDGNQLRRFAIYGNGRLHWSPSTGTHEVHGAIAALGIPGQWPITDELATPDGVGRYNDFENGLSIYWTASTGAHAVVGGIGDKWRLYGRETGLGYPTTGEIMWVPDNVVYQHFSRNAAIYWTPAGGAYEMHGGIRTKFDQQGGYLSLGYPTTDESGTPDGVGRFNHFSRGWSIYWTASTGAHEVHGGIRTTWFSLGAERSFLGYPTSDELAVSGGRRTNFQGGYIVWNSATGVATAFRY